MNYSRQLCEYLLSNKFIKINLNRIGIDYEGLITISYNNLVLVTILYLFIVIC